MTGALYVFSGTTATGKVDDFLKLDITTLIWNKLAASGDVPGARIDGKFAVLDDALYLFGGGQIELFKTAIRMSCFDFRMRI